MDLEERGRSLAGLLLFEDRNDLAIRLGAMVQITDQPQCLVAVEPIVMELVAEGLQAGVAGGLAALGAAGEQFLRRGDEFRPAVEHLLQQARAARHRVVDQQVELVVRLADQEQLHVVLSHVQQPGRRHPQGFADDHRRIVATLRDRDPKEARRVIHEHLNRTVETLLSMAERDALERTRQEMADRRDELLRRTAI